MVVQCFAVCAPLKGEKLYIFATSRFCKMCQIQLMLPKEKVAKNSFSSFKGVKHVKMI